MRPLLDIGVTWRRELSVWSDGGACLWELALANRARRHDPLGKPPLLPEAEPSPDPATFLPDEIALVERIASSVPFMAMQGLWGAAYLEQPLVARRCLTRTPENSEECIVIRNNEQGLLVRDYMMVEEWTETGGDILSYTQLPPKLGRFPFAR